MMLRRTFTIIAAIALSAGGTTLAQAQDQTSIPYQPGDPQLNGCPAGFEALALSDLAGLGYHVPFVIDAAGNNDGIVCGKPWVPQEQAARAPDAPVIIFGFEDNKLLR